MPERWINGQSVVVQTITNSGMDLQITRRKIILLLNAQTRVNLNLDLFTTYCTKAVDRFCCRFIGPKIL